MTFFKRFVCLGFFQGKFWGFCS